MRNLIRRIFLPDLERIYLEPTDPVSTICAYVLRYIVTEPGGGRYTFFGLHPSSPNLPIFARLRGPYPARSSAKRLFLGCLRTVPHLGMVYDNIIMVVSYTGRPLLDKTPAGEYFSMEGSIPSCVTGLFGLGGGGGKLSLVNPNSCRLPSGWWWC